MLRDRRAARGFTLVELLVVIAIISVIAGFLIPTLMKARGRADEVACQSNLREIQKLGMLYADTPGNRFYPFGKGTNPLAHESLNVLIKANQGTLKPAMFICPTWKDAPADVDENGNFQLEEQNCAYAWVKKRVSPSDPSTTPLSCDKKVRGGEEQNGHQGFRQAVFLDGHVEAITVEKVPADELPKNMTM